MSESVFQVGAPGVEVERLVADIQAAVARKADQGEYADARIARAERLNLANLKDDEDFLACYIRSLREAAFVDINDFDIIERRSTCAGLLVALKKVIWKLLKFYTYRLWSQQNQVNGMLLGAFETLENRYSSRIKELESRIAQLEQKSGKS